MNQTRSRILIVEDEMLVRWSLVTGLRRLGYLVDGVETGEEAVTRLNYDEANLLILDVNLPGMSGLEVLESVRARGSQVPAIVITAFEDAAVLEICRNLGVYELIGKPFALEKITTTVAAALGGAAGPREGPTAR